MRKEVPAMNGLVKSLSVIVVALTVSLPCGAAQDESLSVTLTGQETVFAQATSVAVAVDIQPGLCPNPLDVRSTSLLPVAILGTDTFPVKDIDVSSVQLEGVSAVSNRFADVATPLSEGSLPCDCTTEGADGYRDLILNFRMQDIVAVLGSVANNDTIVLTLTGILRNRLGSTLVEGSACVVIMGVPDGSIVPAQVRVSPSSLFLQDIDSPRYREIRCDIDALEGYEVSAIDASTVRLNETIEPVKSQFKGNSLLSLRFLTADIGPLLQPGSVELIVTGTLTNGESFEGRGSILVLP
jgi:hypothetical protein